MSKTVTYRSVFLAMSHALIDLKSGGLAKIAPPMFEGGGEHPEVNQAAQATLAGSAIWAISGKKEL